MSKVPFLDTALGGFFLGAGLAALAALPYAHPNGVPLVLAGGGMALLSGGMLLRTTYRATQEPRM